MAVTPPPSGPSHAGVVAGHVLAGRYRLDVTLASGGMATVWRGTDEVLRRAVAVKVLHPHLTADETFVARFRQEAIAVAKLSHPAIVSVYDTCSQEGVEAIVMELVTGNTLRQHLDAGPMDPWIAANVATQVAGALQVAHVAGLVHRDIKPANILISDDGRVKVGDFGIAKAAESSTDLTKEGSFVGTAKYLAPEQVEGKPVDARTDLYSLGVVIYEMLCGRPPFEADGSSATALARLHSDPAPPRALRPAIPVELEHIALRLLARDPAARFGDANELHGALLGAGADGGVHTTGSQPVVAAPPAQTGPATPRTALHGTGAPALHQQPHYQPSPYGQQPRDHTEVRGEDPERNWLVPTLLILLTAISLGIAGLLISRSGNAGGEGDADLQTGQTTVPEFAPVNLAAAGFSEFDPGPDGDGSEDPENLPNLYDGDTTTTWRTDGYHSPALGGLKEGVGFTVDLGGSTRIQQVELDTESDTWDVEIYVSDSAFSKRSGLGTPVASSEDNSTGTTTLTLDEPAEGQHLLVYFTKMDDTPAGGGHRVVVSEIRVLG